MIIRRITSLLAFYALFHGCFFGKAELTLKGLPAFAVIGPGADTPAVLECLISGTFNSSSAAHSFWSIEDDGTILSYDDNSVKSNTKPTHDYQMRKLWLTLSRPRLTDERSYICQLSVQDATYKSTVDLHINQLPTVSLKRLRNNVVEGEQSTVATCHAALSKPAVSMWFENSKGEKISTENAVTRKECDNQVVNSSLSLIRTFTRDDADETYYCVIGHPNLTEPYRLKVPKVDIYYPPTIPNAEPKKPTVVLPEGISFEMSCKAEGNPSPEVKWTFTPDVIGNEDKQSNSIDNLTSMPNNFMVTQGNERLYSPAVRVNKNGLSSNNGTFTCTASNGIPPSASATFQLRVFALPPTTVPLTTPAPKVGVTADNDVIGMPGDISPELQTSGLSAAVIAGVVAVAVFVIIITVILLLRYFMSHKGEYYTHELKSTDGPSSESFEEEDGLPACEEDLLGDKKRKEHFM